MVGSVAVAWMLTATDVASFLLGISKEFELLAIFIAGFCFVSIFTILPATIVLGQFAVENSLPIVVLFGGIGALCGDYVIFRFFRNRVSGDMHYLASLSVFKQIKHFHRLRVSRWLFAIIGAIVIASPLPDEVGLAMMGLTKIGMRLFVLLSFSLNALGILMIGMVARAITG